MIGKNKGWKHTSEAKEKMSLSKKGKPSWNKGLKGVTKSWNKGLKYNIIKANKNIKELNEKF
jgi:hypothetical protein